jgi:thiamine transport system ATP-binding protein
LPALYVTHDHEEAFALADRLAVMRAGRVVQTGAPDDVWRRPVDEWTAVFLGFGPVVDADRADGRVATPWGGIAAVPPGKPGAVRVVLRPDAVRLDAAGPVAGCVAASVFGGDRTELTVDIAGASLRVRVSGRDAPAVGERVQLAIDPDAVLVYPAG